MRVLLIALLACAGCRSADYQSGHLRCAASSPRCPAQFHCASDGACWRDGEDPPAPDIRPDLSLDLGEFDFGVRGDLAAPDLSFISTADLLADDSGCAGIDPASCCGTMFNLCGAPIVCTGTCGADTLCGGAIPNQCGCPPASRTSVYRAVAGDGTTCYAIGGDAGACPGFVVDATPQFYAYQGDPPSGTKPLLRCKDGARYTLTLDPNCDGSPTAVADTTIGYIPTTPACGTVSLHRYSTTNKGVVYLLDATQRPAGSTELTPPFLVWLN